MNARHFAWIVGGLGLILCAVGAVLQPENFAFAWLAASVAWARWPLGCLAILLTHALTGGRWGDAIRPGLLRGICALPLILVAVVPVIVLLPDLYAWARPGVSAHLPNGFFLNRPFAAARWVVYLVVWFGIGGLSIRRGGRPLAGVAAPGLILLGLTANFAFIDAIMSLDPSFNSSIFGMMNAAESALFAMSVVLLTTQPGEANVTDDLGRLLQGLLILWAYLDFMQLLIVWQSDLPQEAHWYLPRMTGIWGAAAVAIAIGHVLMPFLALLTPAIRRSTAALRLVTAVLIIMSIVRSWWLVLPQANRPAGWIDFAAVAAFAGVSAALILRPLPAQWQSAHA